MGCKDQTFPVDPCNYTPTVWPKVTKFGILTYGEVCVSNVSAIPHTDGYSAQSSPESIGTHYRWPRVAKFSMVTREWGACFWGSAMPQTRSPSIPKFLWPPTVCIAWETAAIFCLVIKCDVRNVLTVSTTPPALATVFVTRMLLKIRCPTFDFTIFHHICLSKKPRLLTRTLAFRIA